MDDRRPARYAAHPTRGGTPVLRSPRP